MACHVFVFLMFDRRTAASTPGRVNVLGMGIGVGVGVGGVPVDEFENANATMVDDGGRLINACADIGRFLLGWTITKTNIAVKIEIMHEYGLIWKTISSCTRSNGTVLM
jgi:hypothetical protein